MKRLVINDELCVGNGRCYAVAPALFSDDERGYGQVTGDGTLDDGQLELAESVVRACPEGAISIEEV